MLNIKMIIIKSQTTVHSPKQFCKKSSQSVTIPCMNLYYQGKAHRNKKLTFSTGVSKLPRSLHIYSLSIKIYAHCFVVLCSGLAISNFHMDPWDLFTYILQGCSYDSFSASGVTLKHMGKIVRLQTATKHKTHTACIFYGLYCIYV